MVITNFMKTTWLGLLLISSLAVAQQDIPFDPSVPETGAGTGAENAPPPPSPAVDNTAPTNAAPPPPAALPSKAANTADELNGTPPPPPPSGDVAAPVPPPQVLKKATRKQTPAELSGLGKLAPFSDVAVITKRFLPKTHRFEFFPNFGLIMNDAFFSDVVVGGRLGFYFNENWGIEASGMSISSSQKGATNELQSDGIQTTSLSTPTSYFGADVKWSPIYGKVAFLNESIVPFDFYFSAGVGETTAGTSNVTGHLGAGQLFAITKWLAGRWDISWYGYSATPASGGSSSFYTNLHATIGVSFFFPGATYR